MRSTRLAALAAVCLGSLVSTAFAQTCELTRGVPCPNQSTIEPFIVGNTSGIPMSHYCPPGGTNLCTGYSVTVRDFQGTPVSGAKIRVHFVSAGLKALTVQTGMTVDCAGHYIQTTAGTTGTGFITFNPRFGGMPTLYAQEVEILAVTATQTVSLGFVQARTTDFNADGKVNLPDLALFAGFLNSGDLRADYDLSWYPTLQDFSIFTQDFNASIVNPPCP